MKQFFSLLFILSALALQAQSVQFIRNGKFAEAQAKAKGYGKLIFVDVYADWCGPCKMMDQQVFSDPEVAGRLNAFFVNIKADAEGKGQTIKQQFQVRGYPTLLFLTADGEIIQQFMGAVDKQFFLLMLNSTLSYSADGEIFQAYENAWNNEQQSGEIADTYFSLRTQYQLKNDSLLNVFLKELPAGSLENPAIRRVFVRHVTAMEGKPYEYLVSCKNNPGCANALKRVIDTQFKIAVAQKSETQLAKVLAAVTSAALEQESVIHRQAAYKMQFYLDTDAPHRFHDEAASYVPNHLIPLITAEQDSIRLQAYAQTLENIAWQYAEYVKKKSHLTQVLTWLNRCPEEIISKECQRHRETISRKSIE